MMPETIIPCGDDALRVVTGQTDLRYGIATSLQGNPAWTEVIVGRESVTVQFNPLHLPVQEAVASLSAALTSPNRIERVGQPPLVLSLFTDGDHAPDLSACAAANHHSENELIDRIVSSELVVDMIGFAPGFAYIAGVDPTLSGERLAHPRQKTPAGSIGFIKGFLGVYALEGPGGWPIIGHTDFALFDKNAENPVILSPGRKIILKRA